MIRLLGLIGIVLLGACETKKNTHPTEIPLEIASQKNQPIRLMTLDGKPIVPKEGKTLILNLWATWCKPCIEEMPALERMADQLPDHFELILASDEKSERIQAFVNRQSLALTFAHLASGQDALGVYSLPTTIIIGSDGKILQTMVGARAWDSPEQINELLSLAK